jgi:hypothetical protein
MKAKNEKKAYSKPGVEVLELKNRCNLLQASMQRGQDGGDFG